MVGGSFTNFLELPKHINAFLDNGPKLAHRATEWWNANTKISGEWTTDNEGDLEENKCNAEKSGNIELANDATLPAAMDIKAYADKVDGEIVSEGLKSHYIYSRVEVLGSASGSHADIIVYDYIGGKKVGFAELQLTHVVVNGEECLRAKVVKQADAFFPDTFTLHRASRAISSGEWNSRYQEDLLTAVKKWSEGKQGPDGKHRICEPNCKP